MIREIRDSLEVTIKAVKERLNSDGVTKVSGRVTETPALSIASPFVNHNGVSGMSFTYSVSTYGGEDILLESRQRKIMENKIFSEIT